MKCEGAVIIVVGLFTLLFFVLAFAGVFKAKINANLSDDADKEGKDVPS
jgi:hypothetical protein